MALSYRAQLNGFLQAAGFVAEQSTPYDDSGSDSGDQFRPPELPDSEEEDDLEDDVEEEDEEQAKFKPTKAKSKKGKLKPGRKDIIATRKTHATAGTPSTGSTDSAPPRKKARKEIAGIVTDWESHRKTTLSAATSLTSIDADEYSMVKQGGMVSDDEHDDAERSATIAKRPTAPQKGGKGKLVSESVHYQFTLLLNNSAAEYHQDKFCHHIPSRHQKTGSRRRCSMETRTSPTWDRQEIHRLCCPPCKAQGRNSCSLGWIESRASSEYRGCCFR